MPSVTKEGLKIAGTRVEHGKEYLWQPIWDEESGCWLSSEEEETIVMIFPPLTLREVGDWVVVVPSAESSGFFRGENAEDMAFVFAAAIELSR